MGDTQGWQHCISFTWGSPVGGDSAVATRCCSRRAVWRGGRNDRHRRQPPEDQPPNG